MASVILSLLFLIAALVVLFDLIQPEYANVMAAKSQAAGEQAFLDAETAAVAQAQSLVSAYQGQSQGQQSISLALPPSEDQAGALAQIYGIAQNSALVIQNVVISPPTIQMQPSSVTDSGNSAKQLVKPPGAVSFQIATTGSYESLKNFISQLETNARLFDLKGISIAQASGSTTKDFFNYNITVVSYYQTP